MRALDEQSGAGHEPYSTLAELLRQRAIPRGPVLVLTDDPRRSSADWPSEYTLARPGEATTLLARADFQAVAVSIGSAADPDDPGALLDMLGASLPADAVLAFIRPRRGGSGERQAAHSMLRRSGFDRIWVETRGRSLCATARRASSSGTRTCSIIVPVYNERETFPILMRALLAKRLDHLGLEREIIVVESNSTDGTRDLVAGFTGAADVTVLWQDRPRGKGHAVRRGLQAATGDIVLIQDADLEYDLEDYDALLQPLLLQDQVDFVLGSRHTGQARMRQFSDQPLLGDLLNAAHLCFATVINVLYGQSLKDPFTMFKVFRRDCLYGLELECDRFDFDHELLIKLLLKGYVPLEVPVSYCSRSFKQGKKIRMFRDPPTWLRADLRYRLRRLEPRFDEFPPNVSPTDPSRPGTLLALGNRASLGPREGTDTDGPHDDDEPKPRVREKIPHATALER
ncbi:MAG TPA: glycosyltransferase family 2 protein [Steroidobacteraceae bacterium]|nr:glycosyltransferase family 2 protein [Steroidobacteraceae bacterium]